MSIFNIVVFLLLVIVFNNNLYAERGDFHNPVFQMRGEHFFSSTGESTLMRVWLQWQSNDLRFVSRPTALNGCESQVKINFAVRGEKKRILYQWQTVQSFFKSSAECTKESSHYALKTISLPKGTYTFTCEVEDVFAQTFSYKELIFVFTGDDNLLSDVQFFQDFGQKKPMIGNLMDDEAGILPYRIHIRSQKNHFYTLKAALYHKEDRTQGEFATHYLLVQQKNRGLASQQTTYQDFFSMEGLSSGVYLIEVYLFEDQNLIARQSRSCILPWKGLKKVRSNLNLSIEQMAIIAPKGVIQSLKKISDTKECLEAFQDYWKRQNISSTEEHPTATLEQYYQSVAEADRLYSTATSPGWKTARGRIFLQFGKPNQIKKTVHKGYPCELWYYHRYGRVIPFIFNRNEWLKADQSP